MIAGHNLLDNVRAEDLGEASGAWHVLHQPGLVPLGDSVTLYILYPLVPWIGVMASGYLLGPVMQLDQGKRQRILLASVRQSRSASWSSVPPTSMVTRRRGHLKTPGSRQSSHSSIVRNTRHRSCT